MNAMNSRNTWKQMMVCLSMLLFLLAYTEGIQSQQSRLYKPTGFNSWKPSRLLPNPNQGDMLDSVVRTNFTVIMRDGVVIDCLKWIPTRTAPAGGWPTVIMHHGYGDHKETLAEFCRLQAQYGYYTMTFSVRGQGLSGGLSNLISRTEAMDLMELVNYVKADSVNGSNPNNILIMGGSQGGAVPLMAVCMGLQVRAIINSVAPPDFASSWIQNGCVKMSLLWTLDYTPDTARYNSQTDRMSDWIFGDTKQGWDSLAHYLPIDRDFYSILQNNTVPVLVEAAWQDKFFDAEGWLRHIDKINAPMTSYVGAVRGHGADVSLTEDQWHMDWFNNWMLHWLWNIPTPILSQAKYQYASTTFPVVDGQYFTFIHDSTNTLLRNISTPMKLYLNSSGRLRSTKNSNSSQTSVLKNNVANNYSLETAINEEFKGSNFTNKFKTHSLTFQSQPLTSNLEWTGTSKIGIDYKSTASQFVQFNVQLYEVLSNGESRFINRANYMDRNYTVNQRKKVVFNGCAHSHIFKQGSRIKVVITNLDRAHTDTAFFHTNPFVLPSMKKGNHSVYLSADSYVQLPIVTTGGNATLFSEESESSVSNNEPYKFSLSQNFPNPFNPATMIEYSIAKAENVQLKVYDLLGREIATLVNGIQVPGSYNVTFNASKLSSGVYFYKLTAGSYTSIKRMVLIK